jgi:hypothetical protein
LAHKRDFKTIHLAGAVAQVVECLPRRSLEFKPCTTKKAKNHHTLFGMSGSSSIPERLLGSRHCSLRKEYNAYEVTASTRGDNVKYAQVGICPRYSESKVLRIKMMLQRVCGAKFLEMLSARRSRVHSTQ